MTKLYSKTFKYVNFENFDLSIYTLTFLSPMMNF